MAQTAQEKAKEALEISDRKVKKLEEKRDKAKADLAAAITALEAECETNDYLKVHPALKSLDEHKAAVAAPAAQEPEVGNDPATLPAGF